MRTQAIILALGLLGLWTPHCTDTSAVVGADAGADIAADTTTAPDTAPPRDTTPPPDTVPPQDTLPADGMDALDSAPARCMSDSDCGAGTAGMRCDTASGRCVECLPAMDTCRPEQHCDPMSLRCVPGCHTDEGCAAPDGGMHGDGGAGPSGPRRCERGMHVCVECTQDEHCPPGFLCVGQACVAGCSAARACPSGQTCCAGACVDGQSSLTHCGRCDNRCAVANGTAVCMNGTCAVGLCSAPFADCDAMAGNGCETDTQRAVAHCGGCGMACAPRAHAAARCEAGRCAYSCDGGFADCDGDPANGCEADTREDLRHCGTCVRPCTPPNATPRCAAGACAVERCNDGFGDCDLNASNGCETNLRVTVNHCGRCGAECPARANSFPGCVAGACVLSCVAGFQDCDDNPANGCEVDTRRDARHCGACGRSCAALGGTLACEMSVCRVTGCDPGRGDCDGSPGSGCETDLRATVAHCGACGTACPARPNAAATCADGACGLRCDAGFGDCDGDPSNGCESDLRSAVGHCGRCGNACPGGLRASAVCSASACALRCDAGFGDCDGDPVTGCETGTTEDTRHCGGCGRVCAFPGASSSCRMGVCGLGACTAGLADCDRAAMNGCEVDTRTTVAHCGGCGVACAPPAGVGACVAGACTVASCSAGFANCNGSAVDGCEASLASVGSAPTAARRFAPAGSGADQTPSEDISVEVGPRDEVYVLSYSDKIIIFDADGTYLRNIPRRTWSTAWAIAVARDTGEMWLADPNTHQVLHLTAEGNPADAISGITGVRGVEFARGEVYVTEYTGSRVAVYARDGTFQRNIAVPGAASPRGLAVGATGTLYVASSGNNTVRVVNPDGTLVRAVSVCATPSDVAVDECRGVLYVNCEGASAWAAYRLDGTMLYTVPIVGAAAHHGITLSSDGSRLYVSHTHGGDRATVLYRR